VAGVKGIPMSLEVTSILDNILGGVFASLLTSIILWIGYRMFQNRLYTKRIIKPNDQDVEKLIEVYEAVLPSNYRSPATDIVRWLEEYQENRKDPNHTLEEYWLVGKVNGRVVSFLFFQYYVDSKFLFISYLGVDKRELREGKLASKTVLAEFCKRLEKELRECRGIVYETAAPKPGDSPEEKREKLARNKLFKCYAKQLGFHAYEIEINYVAPKISIETNAFFEEERLALSYIPLKAVPREHTLPKDEVMDVLHFVYVQVYGDSYKDDEEKDKQYRSYLIELLNKERDLLPEKVPLL
jgi:hypothetical protein